jgi:hypothetical protein
MPSKKDSIPLEDQLRVLTDCGIKLAPFITPEYLAHAVSGGGYEKDPYLLLLCVLGGEAEGESPEELFGYLSDNIWHFDTECIDDHGSYAAIASRMAVLAQGGLPLLNVEDYVDVEEGEAWLSFTLDDRSYKWPAKVDDDWVDPFIIAKLTELLDSRNVGKRFTYINLGGQDCLIGCATPEQRSCLESQTGLKVEWLT